MSIVCPICDNDSYILGYACHVCGLEEDASDRGFFIIKVEEVMQDA